MGSNPTPSAINTSLSIVFNNLVILPNYVSVYVPANLAGLGCSDSVEEPFGTGRLNGRFRFHYPGCKIARNFDPTFKVSQRIDLVAKYWNWEVHLSRPIVTPPEKWILTSNQ